MGLKVAGGLDLYCGCEDCYVKSGTAYLFTVYGFIGLVCYLSIYPIRDALYVVFSCEIQSRKMLTQ